MAMAYGNAVLNDLFRSHFKPAAAQAGFDLVRLDEKPQQAGLIDNHMRVEVRRARFVVADLSDKNAGGLLGGGPCWRSPENEEIWTARRRIASRGGSGLNRFPVFQKI